MNIKKGDKLIVTHDRKGKFNVIAKSDFDTEKVDFYPVILDIGQNVSGQSNLWAECEEIPCRASLCKIERKE